MMAQKIEIPTDLQIGILKRLPMKSLARFKCVSKLWYSLIRSQGYLFASPPRLYISLVPVHSCLLMEEDCPVPVNSELLSFSLTSSNVFELDSMKQGFGGYDMVVLRGLILYTVCERACIYNPTTGQRVNLPAIEFNRYTERTDYFMGYDPVLDQYKIVCTAAVWAVYLQRIYSEHWVFVLEAGSSWRKIEFDQPHTPSSSRQGLCINGVIYYLAFSSVSGDYVISFDVRSEEFNMIQLPHPMSVRGEFLRLGLVEYGGKPTLFDYIDLRDLSGLVNLWVLEDTGKWSKISLVLQPCQMHLVPDNIQFKVIGTTQNGEVVLQPEVIPFPGYILYYDLLKNDLRRVDIRGLPDLVLDPKSTVHLALMDTGESIMHLTI